MASITLSSAGSTLGSALGGPVGASLGATLGGLAGAGIDTALFANRIDGPRLRSLHVMESREGAGVPLVYGRWRVGGQVIWAARFKEDRSTTQAGKGGPSISEYRYSISFAVGLGQGPVTRINRAWANGEPLALGEVSHRFYPGSETQAPDPLIEAIEGTGAAPAYRGTAYVVFEDLPLERFGNRMPQLSFEIVREPPKAGAGESLKTLVKGVNLIPSSGEFAYGTEIVRTRRFPGIETPQNMNNGDGRADLLVSLDQLEADLPAVERVALTVGWFGDDLRAGQCRIRPGVEVDSKTTRPYGWRAGGVGRSGAYLISKSPSGGSNYGGTPADRSVVQAIRELNARGLSVTYSPFLFMDVPSGNGLPDPYGGVEQAAFPWRGRITPFAADKTAAAGTEVAAFLGFAQVSDFEIDGDEVDYLGDPNDWGFRRFILHQAWLAHAAGGVESYLLGSEMVRLSQARDGAGAFPFVAGLQALAADVRQILGSSTKISYAADWTEYAAYAPGDGSNDVLFPLDPLWASPDIDYVGLDWYPPTGDWRDGTDHLDALAGYSGPDDPAYLAAQMMGGEAYDWYYASQADRDAQIRTPIVDTAHGEDWVFRQKDLRGWYDNPHHERPGGVRNAQSTAWIPGSKPVRLSEIGFPAVDKGPNSPNLFYDPKSAESALPPYSNGTQNDVLQRRALEAALAFWITQTFVDGAYIWAWDARPWPDFPSRSEIWSDGANWAFGHWLNGRAGLVELADAVSDLCSLSGVAVQANGLRGLIEGYGIEDATTLRRALEPLKQVHDWRVAEHSGDLVFEARDGVRDLAADDLTDAGASWSCSSLDKAPEALRLSYVDASDAFSPAIAETRTDNGDRRLLIDRSLPIAMAKSRSEETADRLLREARASERGAIDIVPTMLDLSPGDVVRVPDRAGAWRIGEVVDRDTREIVIEAHQIQNARNLVDPHNSLPAAPIRAEPEIVLVDAPDGDENAGNGPLIAVAASPWSGAVRIFAGPDAAALTERGIAARPAIVGQLLAPLAPGPVGRVDRRATLMVEAPNADLASATEAAFLGGANTLFVQGSDGWERLQFRDVDIIAPGRFRLRHLLRGQMGTSPVDANTGGVCVFEDAALKRAVFQRDEVGAPLQWRALYGGSYGALFSAVHSDNAGLPWRPVHGRAAYNAAGALTLYWVRRAAEIGGNLDAPDILTSTRYRLLAFFGDQVVRDIETTASEWTYADADSDQADRVEVAEIGSDGRLGPPALISLAP